LFKSLESFPLKSALLRLLAASLRSNLRFSLDHPFTMVLSTGTAHTLAVNDDGNGNVSEAAFYWLPSRVRPRFNRLISAAQCHQLAMHRTARTLRLRGRVPHRDSIDREADAEVTDLRHEGAGLSTIDRYGDV